ncbi:cell adhesion molecule CEACAM1-like isoform X2 [Phyllobates terribilis]|uniref:cell adhesion molecule CEACAM1-like isoform X2 n=1 Tax=Phyllobates terribilis TaxID=111132 RepID=UPI003CCB41D5
MNILIMSVLLILTMDVTSGQISIQPIPQYPVINGSITLSVMGITEKLEAFIWYKGQYKSPPNQILTYIPDIGSALFSGRLYNDRISAFNNGSILIKDLHITDGGNYIVDVQTVTSAQDVNVTLIVYEPVTKPEIISATSQHLENYPFHLFCNTYHAMSVIWTMNSASILSGTEFSKDNKTLSFSGVREESGEYRCEASNVISKDISDPYTVNVIYGPDEALIEGTLNVKPGSSITITCSADSYPPPEYQWKLNDNVLLENTNKYNISNAAPKDEGLYTCVVRNPVTNHIAIDSVHVNVKPAFNNYGLILGLGIISGVVAIAFGSVCLYRKYVKKRLNGSSEAIRETINVYENVKEVQPQEESSYTSLQDKTEDTYTQLKTQEIAIALAN